MRILGISAFYHDSAAALIEDGRIAAAAQEERFTRKRFDERFPEHALQFCLREASCTLQDVDRIVFYDKPFEKFDRILETHLAYAPKGFATFRRAMPVWLKEKLFLKKLLLDQLGRECAPKLRFSDHHLSHAASAFYPSPFEEAVVLVLDGVGEWATASVYVGRGTQLEPVSELRFPHSLGLLYSAFTAYCGFKVNSGEYKLMGLAPYGKPRFRDLILENLVRVAEDGSFALNMEYFDFPTHMRMTGEKFEKLLGQAARPFEGPMSQHYKDVAASIQLVTEEILVKMTRTLAEKHGLPNLCMAGGVALNCVANGKILRDQRFRRIWIQPAAGDAGGALGAALAVHYLEGGTTKRNTDMLGAYLGPEYSDEQVARELKSVEAVFTRHAENELLERVAGLLAEGKAVGWFQGRSEFGPRALGNRSILADARVPKMQSILNQKIKFRESFRPFAPAVTREAVNDWFELDVDSPYMLLVGKSRGPSLPAVTHVDGSARVQTVHRETNPRFHALLERFGARTGCPVLVNTSFNVRGEPIVNAPLEAWRCFMGTDLDALAIGSFLLLKSEQRVARKTYHEQLEKD